jgi:hypothetical protein
MINKTNLIKSQSHKEGDSVEFSMPIIPDSPGIRINYEYEIELNPLMEYLARPSESAQEILYFTIGSGVVKSAELEETVIRGDRIITTSGEKYRVLNTSKSLLQFKLIGISFKDK